MLEWDEAHNTLRARELFAKGAAVPQSYQHAALYKAWSVREAAAGDAARAAALSTTGDMVAARRASRDGGTLR